MSQRRGWAARVAGSAAVLAMVLWSAPTAYAEPAGGRIDMVVEGAGAAGRGERSAVATAGEPSAVVLTAHGAGRRYLGHARGTMLAV